MDIFQLLRLAKSKSTSDLHLVVSSPLLLRVNGLLEPVDDMVPLTTDDIDQAFNQITSADERENFHRRFELDFSYTIHQVGGARCNTARISLLSLMNVMKRKNSSVMLK